MSTSSTPSAPPTTDALSAPPQPARLGAVLFVIVTAYLMVGVDSTVVNVALPDIQKDLHFSPTGRPCSTRTPSPSAACSCSARRVGDIAGRRRTLTIGVLLFAGSSLLGGLATERLAAHGARPPGRRRRPHRAQHPRADHHELPRRSAPPPRPGHLRVDGGHRRLHRPGPRRHAHLLGVLRRALLINVPIGIAVAVALPRFVTETPRHAGRFDAAGALAGTAGMTSLVYAFIRVSEESWSDTQALLGFSSAAALLVGFTWIESRADQPIMPLHLFASRNRAGGYAGVLLLPAGMFGAFYFLTLICQQVLGTARSARDSPSCP